MALPAAGVLEIRPTGSATNGGGFVAGGTGTDWSQQDAAQYSVSDGVANGTTTLTSATANFGTDVVDNYVSVSDGTGSITQTWKRIVSRTNATTIVVDSSTGLTAGTGVSLKIGGALASLANLSSSNLVAGNTVHVVGTTFTTAALITLSVDETDGNPVRYVGHAASRDDDGLAVVTSTNAAATSVVSITGSGSVFEGFKIDGGGVSLRGINTADVSIVVRNCWATNCTQYGFRPSASNTRFIRCLATLNGSTAAHGGFGSASSLDVFDRCVARGNGGNGFVSLTAGVVTAINCIAHENTLSGFASNDTLSYLHLIGCTSYGNTLDGVRFTAASTFEGSNFRHNIFYGNAGYGMRSVATDYSGVDAWIGNFEGNAFGANALGARFQVPTGANEITLTADPFTDAANDDFSLNMTGGGGLDLRGLALAFGTIADPETSVGYTDGGAVTSGGSTGASTPLGGMRSLWRELTGEFDTTVIPNAVVDIYLNRGLEWLNQAVEYHMTTGAGGVTLVAGTQEYTLDADVMRVKWVQLAGQELERGDIEEWRNRGEGWRQESGMPTAWAVEGNRIIFRPTPNAAAAAAASAPVMRYVSTPPDIATEGPEQLQSQDRRTAVFYTAHLWSIAYPDSALATQRSEGLLARSREEGTFAQRDAAAKESRR